MENQIKSERTRRSTVLEADGERESAVIKSRGDAAQMVRLQLRRVSAPHLCATVFSCFFRVARMLMAPSPQKPAVLEVAPLLGKQPPRTPRDYGTESLRSQPLYVVLNTAMLSLAR